jgi:hypothetical protein
MCRLAFAHLNNANLSSTPQQETKQTKVIISDAEYMSWKHAVNEMYVHRDWLVALAPYTTHTNAQNPLFDYSLFGLKC